MSRTAVSRSHSAEQHLAALVESSQDAIISQTLDGTIQSWNRAATRLFGFTAEEMMGNSIFTLIPPEKHREEEIVMARLKKGERIEHFETVRRRKDGSLIDVSLTVSPILDQDGMVIGASKVARDVTERRRADSIAYRFAAIVDSSQDAIISKSIHGIVESWNAAAEKIFGYRSDEMIGQPILTLIPEDRRHEEDEILDRIRAGQRIEHFETVRRHKDGSLLDISLTISPIKNARGEIVGASKIARDIRDRKRGEAARELLLNEIKHRVKNTLGTVQAMVLQTFKGAPPGQQVAFSARLQALSSAHDLLTQRNWQGADIADVVERALSPLGNINRIVTAGPAIELAPTKALLFAMLVHELGTNALKYGAFSNEGGKIHLTWAAETAGGKRFVRIRWQETGGPAVLPPTRVGFGTRMIERALKAEGGLAQLDYEPAGLICSIKVSLDP